MKQKKRVKESNLQLILKQFFIKRVYHIVIFLLCVTFFLIFFMLFFPKDTVCIETMRNVSNTKLKEVGITEFDVDEDNSFRCFNGSIYLVDEDMYSISADVFMPIQGRQYYDNIIGFEHELSGTDCLVSKNLMYDSKLSIGDKLYVRNSNVSYTIKGVLPSCIGIDKKYEHEGNVVIAHNEELVNSSSFSYKYVTFLENVDGFSASSKQIFLKNISKQASETLAIDICIYVAIVLTIMVIGELLSYNMRHAYKDAAFDGVLPRRIFAFIMKDMTIKYYLPYLLSFLVCMVAFSLYSVNYLILIGGLFVPLLICSLIVGIIYFRRNY